MDNNLEAVSACSVHWHGTQTKLPRKKVSRTLLEARRVGHQFPEGSNSFNAGWPREGLLWDRQTHLELFFLYVPVSEYVPDNKGEVWPLDLRAGTWPCCVWPWVLGFRQGLDASLLLCLSFWVSGTALACFPVLGRELSAQGTPEMCFD